MLKLSVQQFVAHLPAEQQGPVLVSQEAFLAFLRAEFRANEASKRALVEAATTYARREQVMVHCLADERYAAKAVIYAYMRLGDELLRRGKVRRPRSYFRTYRRKGTKQAPRARQRSTARFRSAETFVNGQRERIEQYPADVTWQEARAFQRNPLYDLPDVELEPEYRVTSETAHFEASVRPTGWGWLMVEGYPVERVRCWENV
jgi:hypothetical protein